MSDTFNPYHQWLGLSADTRRPNHYELLGLTPGEADTKNITVAAEQAATRIRSFRPGSHASDWARLLDEVQAAKLVLLDPARKSEYDRTVSMPTGTSGTPILRSPPAATIAQGSAALADLFPPGFRPANAAANAPASASPLPVASAPLASPPQPAEAEPWNSLPPAAQVAPLSPSPMAGAVGYPAPTAMPVPAAYPAALPMQVQIHPAYPTAIPTAPYGQAMPIDPMSPVTIPGVNATYFPAPVAAGYPVATAAPAVPAIPIAQAIVPQANIPAAIPAGATGMAVVAPAEVAGVRKASAASVMMAARKERQTRNAALMAGAAAGLVIVAGLGAYIAIGSNWNRHTDARIAQANAHHGEGQPAKVDDRHQSSPTGKNKTDSIPTIPATKNQVEDPPSEKPMPPPPQPMVVVERPPMPEPKPEPAAPSPEPKPEPKPEPAPTAKPTRQQIVDLEAALKRARLALSEQSFDDAEKEASKAEKVAILPEHQGLVERLRLAIDHTRLFRQALAEATSKLEAAETIKVGSSTVVAIVETFPDKITVRVNGMNRTYSFASIPKGLAAAILDTKRMGGEPDSRILKAMFVATAKDADPQEIADARGWIREVESSDPNAAKLLAYLDDSYDGIVAAFDSAEKNAAGNSAAAGATQ